MDFIDFFIPWVFLLFFISTAVSLISLYRFNVKHPFFIFNFVNFCAIVIYFNWLFIPRNCDGCGSGAFAMILFSFFFVPVALIVINLLFSVIIYGNMNNEDNKLNQVSQKTEDSVTSMEVVGQSESKENKID